MRELRYFPFDLFASDITPPEHSGSGMWSEDGWDEHLSVEEKSDPVLVAKAKDLFEYRLAADNVRIAEWEEYRRLEAEREENLRERLRSTVFEFFGVDRCDAFDALFDHLWEDHVKVKDRIAVVVSAMRRTFLVFERNRERRNANVGETIP